MLAGETQQGETHMQCTVRFATQFAISLRKTRHLMVIDVKRHHFRLGATPAKAFSNSLKGNFNRIFPRKFQLESWQHWHRLASVNVFIACCWWFEHEGNWHLLGTASSAEWAPKQRWATEAGEGRDWIMHTLITGKQSLGSRGKYRGHCENSPEIHSISSSESICTNN